LRRRARHADPDDLGRGAFEIDGERVERIGIWRRGRSCCFAAGEAGDDRVSRRKNSLRPYQGGRLQQHKAQRECGNSAEPPCC
jgi:hypothetical protein